MPQSSPPARKSGSHHREPALLVPELVEAVRAGYTLGDFRHDALAGLTVAILAVPLSMAIAIGCGVTPDKGLVTSVVAGALISALGGSRFQVGGPAAAFIVVIGAVIARHGYDGMLLATFLAGLILIAAGLMRLGAFIRYVPSPVVIGFTSGIGVLIAIGQLKDFLGLAGQMPLELAPKLAALWEARHTFNPYAAVIGAATLAGIVGLRAWKPRWPGLLIAVTLASAAAWALSLPVATIASQFGGIPSGLSWPRLPELGWSKVVAVLPTALTIAFLVGVESLMSAIAADTKTGTRHNSNMEILAQGVANTASTLFGGLPATGVIARTATNITAGARTPVAGILHAVFVLMLMVLAAPVVAHLALPCLAAVLLNVSWRLLDLHELRVFLTRAPSDDRLVLLASLLLTVLVDLNTAIAVGVVMASLFFMHRMAALPGVDLGGAGPLPADDSVTARPTPAVETLPPGVRVFQFRGPLFYGAAKAIGETLRTVDSWPQVIILRLREVPLLDMTALAVLEDLAETCAKHKCRIVVSGLQRQPRVLLHRTGFLRAHRVILARDLAVALDRASRLQAGPSSTFRALLEAGAAWPGPPSP